MLHTNEENEFCFLSSLPFLVWILPVISLLLTMEEPGEQSIVVFALQNRLINVVVEGVKGWGLLHPVP
jgi:hypothetical protein